MRGLLADAAGFFEAYLRESESCRDARAALAKEGLEEEVIQAFGVGYAPIGPNEMLDHLSERGYSTEEIIEAGLATRSVRGRPHARFRSRVMFPVRDREGRILGFAGLGTHLGPSWPLWVTSPDAGLYRRAEAVFGLDRAAARIDASGTAAVKPDCIEVLLAHQQSETNAVTVHTNRVTYEQMVTLSAALPGGLDALELELAPGMRADAKREPAPASPDARPGGDRDRSGDRPDSAEGAPRHLLKRLGVVIATALAGVNVWTGAPLLALWVGSHVQSGRLLSMTGVFTVVAVYAALAFLLAWALTWLNAKYDEMTGRHPAAGQTSPWNRSLGDERVRDVRIRFGVSAPEKVVAACVVAGALAFEFWFFFLAGSSLPSS